MRKVFKEVSSNYDLMNDVMSIGVHRIWKDAFIYRLSPTPGTKLLDMAGGTGDISFRYIKYLNSTPSKNKISKVTISDINEHMLNVGQQRAFELGYTNEKSNHVNIEWVCSNAEELPFSDHSFDAYTIAFGIRNCTNIEKVVALKNKKQN